MVVTHTAPSSSCSMSSVPGDRQPLLDLSEPGDRGQVEMVGSTSQPYGGQTFPLSMYDDDNRNLRLHGGGSPGQLGCHRRVVDCLGQAAYQLARAPGCMADLETLLAPVRWRCCGGLVRQCHNGSIHQQKGQDSVTLLVPTGISGVEMVCREHLVASHFSGSKNILADALFRGKHHYSTEWSMHKVTVALIFEHWLTPHVYLFVFKKNQVFFSAGPSPTSSGSNALTQKWKHLYGYAFLPFSLIPRVLRKHVAAVSPDQIDEHAGEHADGPPTGDPALGQPPEELGHGNVLPHAGALYGLPPRVFTRGC